VFSQSVLQSSLFPDGPACYLLFPDAGNSDRNTDLAKRNAPPPPESGVKDARINSSLARGLAVLRTFGPDNTPIGNAEIAARVGLPKATVSRLTFTLTELGYINHDEATGRYSLGPSVLTLGYDVMAQMEIRDIARPYMQELARHADASVYLGVRNELEFIYVEACRTPASMAIRLGVGSRIPMETTGMGRAYIAALPETEREALLAQIAQARGTDWARIEPPTRAAIARAIERGYAVSGGDWIAEANSAGAVIRRADGYPAYALNVGGLRSIVTTERLETDLAPRLLETVRKIEDFARGMF
jgi:DNA-binding IclR family transcriptional regulator